MQLSSNRWMVGVLIVIAGLQLSACREVPADAAGEEHAATIEAIKGTDLNRVTLVSQAVERLDIQTSEVRIRQAAAGDAARSVIPYSAVLYDPNGRTWTYTNPEPLTFIRHPIRVDRISGNVAVLKGGPPAGTAVVTMGAAELYGAEYGVGH